MVVVLKKIIPCSVTVLYHPDVSAWENIRSYIKEFEILYLIDNSERTTIVPDDILYNKKIKYISLGDNYGMGYALNKGAQMALDNGCIWLATFDQDSKPKADMIQIIKNYILANNTSDKGIISPAHSSIVSQNQDLSGEESEEIYVMTSGNFLNLPVYQEVGPFEEDYFIDFIDIEYCLRLKSKGYKVVRIKSAILEHKLGETRDTGIMGYVFPHRKKIFQHNAIRTYYITRNRFYCMDKYKNIFPEYTGQSGFGWKILAKLVLFEDNKIKKILNTVRGYLDYKRGRMGKYPY